MLRALVLIAAILFFRAFLPRKTRPSPTAISPYKNSLDSLVSADQVSLVMDGIRLREFPVGTDSLSSIAHDSQGETPLTVGTATDCLPELTKRGVARSSLSLR